MHYAHPHRPTAPGAASRQTSPRRRASGGRDGAGNHARLDARQTPDAHERQAEDAAARLVRGQRGLAGSLSPAPAATAQVPGSTGRPLPAPLRRQLEKGYGAHLERVRLHTDAPAAWAARREHARAFTAGVHIFFDRGSYRPHTDEGQELLAHEVAHVLQQTGRRTTDGRLRATDVQGPGAVQRAGYPAFNEMAELHQPKKATDRPAYQKTVQALLDLVKGNAGWQSDTQVADAVEAYARTALTEGDDGRPIAAWPAEAESLLYDTLKAVGRIDLAVELLERDDYAGAARIWTVKEDLDVEKRLLDLKDPKQLDVVLSRLGGTRFAWTFEIRRLTYRFLFQPSEADVATAGTRRPPPTPRPESGLAAHQQQPFIPLERYLTDLKAELKDDQRLSENEWNWVGLELLKKIELRRYNALIRAHNKAVEKTYHYDVEYLERRAKALQSEFYRMQTSPSDYLEATLGVRIGKQLAAPVQSAVETFEALAQAFAQTSSTFISLQLEELSENPALQAKAKPLRAALLSLAKALEDDSDKGLFPPTEDRFAIGTGRIAEELAKGPVAELSAAFTTAFWASANPNERAEQLLLLRGLLLTHKAAQGLVRRLRSAGSDLDPDQRVADFVYLGRFGRMLGQRMHWDDVDAAFEQALQPTDRTLIGILGKWKRDNQSPTGMLQDFGPDTRVGGMTYLTIRQLTMLLQAQYYRALADQLSALPDTPKKRREAVEQGIMEPDYTPPLNTAIDTLEQQGSLPARWSPEGDSVVALARTGAVSGPASPQTTCQDEATAKTTYVCVLANHPKVKAWTEAEKSRGRSWILPLNPAKGAFGWAYAPVITLATDLSRSAFLRKLVKAQHEQDSGASKPPNPKTEGEQWLLVLLRATNRLLTTAAEKVGDEPTEAAKEALKQLDLLDAAVLGITEAEREAGWTTFRKEQAIARAMYREVLVERIVRPELKAYDDDRLAHWNAPNAVLRYLRGFHIPGPLPEGQDFAAQFERDEAADNAVQLAVLMLQVAPEMDEAFEYERRKDVLTGFLPLLRAALDTLGSDAKEVARIAKLVDPRTGRPARDDAWIKARTKTVEKVFTRMNAAAALFQKTRGIIGDKDEGGTGVLYSTTMPYAIKTGQAHLVRGKVYTFERVAVDFEYHPALTSASGVAQERILVDPGTNKPIEDDVLLLVYSERDPETNAVRANVEVRGRDGAELEKLREVLAWQAFGQSMENLEAGMMLWVEAMSWVPGVGQVVDISRALATVSEFFTSGAYKDLKALLTDGLKKILDDFIEHVHAALTPENVIIFLLFGDPLLDKLLAQADEEKKDKPKGPKPKGALGAAKRVLSAVKQIGRGVKNQLEVLQGRVQSPVRGLRAFVLARPTVRTALHLAEQYLHALAFAGNAPAILAAEKAELGQKVDDLVDALGRLELPREVIDTQAVIGAVLSELFLLLGKRLGLKGRAVTLVLEFAGVLDLVADKIAYEIVEDGFDANTYWRDTVIPALQDDVDAARASLVASLREVLASNVVQAAGVVSDADRSAFDVQEGRFEATEVTIDPEAEAQPYTRAGAPEPEAGARLPAVRGGRPLTRAERDDLETRFGHDFGHVRLHTGDDAAAMTEATGAEGVTTGSHVYLRPGLSPHSSAGREVLLHELAHVLQQTGARPLGGTYDERPRPGRPGRGLRVVPEQEAAARRAAEVAAQPHVPHPVEFGEEDEEGLQPRLPFSTIRRLLGELTSVADVEAARERIDERIAKQGRQEVASLKTPIEKLARALTKPDLPTAFTSVRTEIEKLLQPGTPALSTAAHLIAKDSIVTVPLKKPVGTQTEAQVVDLNTFTMRLQEYVLGRTGVLIQIDWKLEKAEPDSNTLAFFEPGRKGSGQRLDATNPARVDVAHLHLPFIVARGAGETIWDTLIKAHWGNRPTDQKKARQMLRVLLRTKGPDAQTLMTSGTQFRLKKHTVDEVERLMRMGKEVTKVPTINEYVSTDLDAAASSDTARIGLRLAKHGDQSPIGAERESHHLTQFLLVEYFYNDKNEKPFPKGLAYPADLTFDGTKLTSVAAPGGGPAIDLAGQNTSARGKDMPAISLAAVTHQTGDLHIPPGKPDDEVKVATQGQAIHMEFQKHLPALADASAFAAYRKGAGTTEAKRDEAVHEAIHHAMQATYGWMRSHMRKQLKQNVPKLETDYYAGLRDRLTPGDQLTSAERTQMESKIERVVGDGVAGEMNDDMMAALGWPKP